MQINPFCFGWLNSLNIKQSVSCRSTLVFNSSVRPQAASKDIWLEATTPNNVAHETAQSKSTSAPPCSPGSLGPFGFFEPSTTFMLDCSMPYFSSMKGGRTST